MVNSQMKALMEMRLAPYIQKATALIRLKRKTLGGCSNMFRHQMDTLAVLIDHKYVYDPVLLKASLIHDLFEELPNTDPQEIKDLEDGEEVLKLVFEVTKPGNEEKNIFLKRILDSGSENSKLLKAADRISNLTDTHTDSFSPDFAKRYVRETEDYIIPGVKGTYLETELIDLCKRIRNIFGF